MADPNLWSAPRSTVSPETPPTTVVLAIRRGPSARAWSGLLLRWAALLCLVPGGMAVLCGGGDPVSIVLAALFLVGVPALAWLYGAVHGWALAGIYNLTVTAFPALRVRLAGIPLGRP